jgi:hypothetical protein
MAIDHSKNHQLLALTEQMRQAKQIIESDAFLPVMEESIFKQYLPLLISPAPVDLTPWLEIVGTPTKPVIVTRNGKEAYRVPPLASTRGRTTIKHGDRKASINNKIGNVQAQIARIPVMEDSIVQRELSNSMPHYGIDYVHLAEWNHVLKENGLPPLNETQLTNGNKDGGAEENKKPYGDYTAVFVEC